MEEDGKELILTALRVAGRSCGPKKKFAPKIRLAVKMVKLYEELFKSQGRQFCLYVLAEVLAKTRGSKSSKHRGMFFACTDPIPSSSLVVQSMSCQDT